MQDWVVCDFLAEGEHCVRNVEDQLLKVRIVLRDRQVAEVSWIPVEGAFLELHFKLRLCLLVCDVVGLTLPLDIALLLL